MQDSTRLAWLEPARARRRVGIATVHQLEAGIGRPRPAIIGTAFETAGVEFIDENGGGPGRKGKASPDAVSVQRGPA